MNEPPPPSAPDPSTSEPPLERAPERFGTNWVLRAGSVAGLCLWLLVSGWVVIAAGFRVADIPAQTFISLAFFNFLFMTATFYYHRRAIVVDEEGVVVLGALTFESYRWQEILQVEPDPGLLPGHQVITRSGVFGFSGLEIASHQRLFELLSETHRLCRGAAKGAPPPPAEQTDPQRARRRAYGGRRRRRPGRRR